MYSLNTLIPLNGCVTGLQKISQTSLLAYMPVVINQVFTRTVFTIANQKKISKRWFAISQIKLLFGTDAASEGLNLQALGTLN